MSAVQSSQADAAANVRDVSWSYNIGLNVRYPVIERYSVTASLGYGLIDYTQTGGQPLVNLSNYTANLGLFYILNEQRDLFFSYRFRFEPSSKSTSDTDNALMFGVSGKIYGEINGSLSVGYQVRSPHGFLYNGQTLGNEGSMTASGSLTWTANKKLSFTGSISKDFTTTSLDATTDTTAVSLDAAYAMNARLSAGTGIGAGTSLFLGPLGQIPNTNTQRRDYYFSWNANVSYSMGEHLHATLAYGFFKNWSNLGLATFIRNNFSLSLSSRW